MCAVCQVPHFVKSMLLSADTFILDCGSEVYVWVGRGSNPEEKKSAMINAQVWYRPWASRSLCRVSGRAAPRLSSRFSLSCVHQGSSLAAARAVELCRVPWPCIMCRTPCAGSNLPRADCPVQDMLVSQGRSNVRISRIIENAETPLFKSKFFCWDPPVSFDFTASRSKGVAGVRWAAAWLIHPVLCMLLLHSHKATTRLCVGVCVCVCCSRNGASFERASCALSCVRALTARW